MTPKIFIFSVYRIENGNSMNQSNHAKVLKFLTKMGFRFKELMGCYQGTKEKSILLVDTSPVVEVVVQKLCKHTKQDCYLVRSGDTIYLCDTLTGTKTFIGRELVNISRAVALNETAYSYDESTDQYYKVA